MRMRVYKWRPVPSDCNAGYARTYRFFRLSTPNYYGADACARFKSQCDCCEPHYMRLHLKEKMNQEEIRKLVQSPSIDHTGKDKRHNVHFDQVGPMAGASTPAAACTLRQLQLSSQWQGAVCSLLCALYARQSAKVGVVLLLMYNCA